MAFWAVFMGLGLLFYQFFGVQVIPKNGTGFSVPAFERLTPFIWSLGLGGVYDPLDLGFRIWDLDGLRLGLGIGFRIALHKLGTLLRLSS